MSVQNNLSFITVTMNGQPLLVINRFRRAMSLLSPAFVPKIAKRISIRTSLKDISEYRVISNEVPIVKLMIGCKSVRLFFVTKDYGILESDFLEYQYSIIEHGSNQLRLQRYGRAPDTTFF